jgi:eukaryotic-like serine/threonine-protein kinase
MIGRTISHYKILEHLGGGGMGVVYKAQDLKLGRSVALKFLPPELTRDSDAKQRFAHEAKAASTLQHMNICVVHDIDETADGQMFICMEYLEGDTLKSKIEHGPLKVDEAIEIARQITQGLVDAHEHGIIHRDIKPANVLVTRSGVAKIVDFGLAKLSGRSMLTKTGSTLGTAAYMSPEQARGETADQRTDIWSLGVLLYEMLTGKRPFDAEYENAQLYSILNADPEPITGLRSGVPMELERIVRKCLSKSPKERYQHADELIVDLRAIQTISSPQSGSTTTVPRDRKMRTRVLFAVGGLIIVALGAWFFFGRPLAEMSDIRKKSIAVLPFSPFDRSFDDTVFADGIHDDILTQLSKISGLRVIARTSMVLYRDSKKTPHEIGNELDAGYLLEGSTRRSGGKIRITAQLIKTATDDHVWAETYDRNDADVFAVQSDIALRIASSMNTAITSAEKAQVQEVLTTNTEAYNFYLRGKYYYDNYTDTLGKAIAADCFEKAAELDPTFTQAFAMAAMANFLVWNPLRQTRSTLALDRARALNPEEPLVLWARAYSLLYPGLQSPETRKLALELYRKALTSRPNLAELHREICEVLLNEGALTEARASARTFFSLSPLSLSVSMNGVVNSDPFSISSCLKDWEAARKEVDEYIARRPDDPYGYRQKATILINGFGDLKGARKALEDGRALTPNQFRGPAFEITSLAFWRVNYLEGKYHEALTSVELPHPNIYWNWARLMQKGQTYVALGRHRQAMVCFDSAFASAERFGLYGRSRCMGIALAWRGEHEKARLEMKKAKAFDLRWPLQKQLEEAQTISSVLAGDNETALNLLEKSIAEPGLVTVWSLRLDPVYNSLRNNPRFQALLANNQ